MLTNWISIPFHMMMLNQMKKERKNKEKKPKPNTGGHDKPFWK
jgi:hypothetical protein